MEEEDRPVEADRVASLQVLVARLAEENVSWEEVEAHLTGFPGWRLLVRNVRYEIPFDPYGTMPPDSSEEYLDVPKGKRLTLHGFFMPFALLLEESRSPGERAVSMQDAGIDVMRFCKEYLKDGIPEISAAARIVYEACNADKTLLRPSDVTSAPKQLLRTPSTEDAASDSLLRSSETTGQEKAEAVQNWLKRIFSRRKS